jgi:hypothetical protein
MDRFDLSREHYCETPAGISDLLQCFAVFKRAPDPKGLMRSISEELKTGNVCSRRVATTEVMSGAAIADLRVISPSCTGSSEARADERPDKAAAFAQFAITPRY